MTGGLSKNFHGVGIGPLSKILAVKVKISQNFVAFSEYMNFKRTSGVELGREINTTPVTREKIEIAPSHHVDNY